MAGCTYCLHLPRAWLLVRKNCDAGLYLNPPLNALVVDEEPSIQAIQRPSDYVETDSGAVVRAMTSTTPWDAEPCSPREKRQVDRLERPLFGWHLDGGAKYQRHVHHAGLLIHRRVRLG